MITNTNYTFIDLFAGLGGFHQALEQLGCQCVFASELREDLRHQYAKNFSMPYDSINSDITTIVDPLTQVPPHDILCGGFPCQPFSKAGKRQGFDDKDGRGNLFEYICDILKAHHPKYLFLENVANLEGHDGGNTWRVIQRKLDDAGYFVRGEVLSPHEFGIPQHRKRIYIVGVRKDLANLENFEFPKGDPKTPCTIASILDAEPQSYTPLKPLMKEQLKVWQEFIDSCVKHTGDIPHFPVWAMEFGATYEFEDLAPAYQPVSRLIGKRGNCGQIIENRPIIDCLKQLPNYARASKETRFPKWKINFIKQNRDFYNKNKVWIDKWMPQLKGWQNSHIKLEWNCTLSDGTSLSNKIVQYRPSGIRVKRPNYSPALTYMGSQIPIFPWANGGRFMTTKEAARLQGMDKIDLSLLSECRVFEALGNAVNVDIVKLIAEKLLAL